ncbi:MAG: hypothetical protein AAF216_11040 [Pseudomonadota bacterium]
MAMVKRNRKKVTWRVSWALQPLGILGGTLSLLDLASLVVEWRSFAAFVVEWWSQTFLDKAREVFLILLQPLGIANVSDVALNYGLLGAILYAQSLRANAAMGPLAGFHYDGIGGALLRVVVFGFLWPVTLVLLSIWAVFGGTPIDADGLAERAMAVNTLESKGVEVPQGSDLQETFAKVSPAQRLESFLITAPFWLFLILCVVNTTFTT